MTLKLLQRRDVNIASLKEFAAKGLPRDCALRQTIMVDDDLLGAGEFASRVPVWLRLLRLVDRQ